MGGYERKDTSIDWLSKIRNIAAGIGTRTWLVANLSWAEKLR
jgi:hypothetical protein